MTSVVYLVLRVSNASVIIFGAYHDEDKAWQRVQEETQGLSDMVTVQRVEVQ